MRLIETAKVLKDKIVELEELRKSAGAADHFERRAKDFEGPARELSQLAKAVTLLRKNSVPLMQLQHELEGWQALLKELEEKYERHPATILDPFPNEDVRAKLLTPLKNLPGSIRTNLSGAWSSWVTGRLPAVNEEILGVLGAIQGLRQSVDKLRTLKRDVLIAAAILPQAQTDIDAVSSRTQAIEKEWAGIAGAGIPEDVIRFLRAAGQFGGAPYAMLTAGVMQWLKDQHLDQSLKVKIG